MEQGPIGEFSSYRLDDGAQPELKRGFIAFKEQFGDRDSSRES
jgi:hypothetical protein